MTITDVAPNVLTVLYWAVAIAGYGRMVYDVVRR